MVSSVGKLGRVRYLSIQSTFDCHQQQQHGNYLRKTTHTALFMNSLHRLFENYH